MSREREIEKERKKERVRVRCTVDWTGCDFCATDVHAGADQAARDALHRRAGMSHTSKVGLTSPSFYPHFPPFHPTQKQLTQTLFFYFYFYFFLGLEGLVLRVLPKKELSRILSDLTKI